MSGRRGAFGGLAIGAGLIFACLAPAGLRAEVVGRASVASDEAEANGGSFAPALGADGRVVAFQSSANNLLGPGGDTNNAPDVYLSRLPTGPNWAPGRGAARTSAASTRRVGARR